MTLSTYPNLSSYFHLSCLTDYLGCKCIVINCLQLTLILHEICCRRVLRDGCPGLTNIFGYIILGAKTENECSCVKYKCSIQDTDTRGENQRKCLHQNSNDPELSGHGEPIARHIYKRLNNGNEMLAGKD